MFTVKKSKKKNNRNIIQEHLVVRGYSEKTKLYLRLLIGSNEKDLFFVKFKHHLQKKG
jgi:hypothetical protein